MVSLKEKHHLYICRFTKWKDLTSLTFELKTRKYGKNIITAAEGHCSYEVIDVLFRFLTELLLLDETVARLSLSYCRFIKSYCFHRMMSMSLLTNYLCKCHYKAEFCHLLWLVWNSKDAFIIYPALYFQFVPWALLHSFHMTMTYSRTSPTSYAGCFKSKNVSTLTKVSVTKRKSLLP